MPSSFPCAICGAALTGNTFEYQTHMTKSHWSGANNSFPLPSIFTSSSMPSPTLHPCFFCDTAFYNIHHIASHMITSHGSDLHSILCPKAGDDSIRESVSAFLNDFAASGAAFVGLCDCFPGHACHTDESVVAYDSGIGSPVSGTSTPSPSPSNITPRVAEFFAAVGINPASFGERVYLYPFEAI
ncbi:unnamed protein product [Aureobasidium mustum]|uniref:C2H2-type domain-containing protein n=1 Tax=Aureobasidium mustum TaxID=2773714 RepID=A0A9N8JQ85_9PEZI|nr:unnamed protein product [Aureobasidium mustum]